MRASKSGSATRRAPIRSTGRRQRRRFCGASRPPIPTASSQFRTIYPGWYQGRATHIHVQVFVNGSAVKTTQIAFPEDVTSSVYRTGVYAAKGQSTTGNSSDKVFADGTQYEMASLSGDTASGYTGTLTIGVAA